MTRQVKIIVADDGGRGLVRLSRRTMTDLGLSPGDLVKLAGDHVSYGRVVPAAVPENTARIDPSLARNAKLQNEACLALVPVDLPVLDAAVVSVKCAKAIQHADLKDALFDMALCEGDIISLTAPMGHSASVQVMSLDPSPAGLLKENTALSLHASPDPNLGYEGIGGMGEQITHVHEMIAAPLLRPDLYQHLGIAAPRGVLFSGPPGSGKTLLARAVARKTKASFFHLNGPEIVTKHYGESEAALRKTFAAAEKSAPSIIFIDEIDAIAPARTGLSSEKQVERRVVAQLLTLMDGLVDRGRIVVMAATNLPDALDPALRRPGRFDREISFRPPSAAQRKEILAVHLSSSPLSDDVDLETLAQATHGFVGADLAALAREAAVCALNRSVKVAGGEDKLLLEDLAITQADLEHGRSVTGPSILRGAAQDTVPVPWTAVGGLEEVKAELKHAVVWPMQHREVYERFGVSSPRGILLCGPPGTGKTLTARALATHTRMNFIPVRPPRLLSEFFGAAERAVSDIFTTARLSAPTLLFFDEFDSLAPRRTGKDPVLDRIVAQFLMELDGMQANRDVFVLAATNRASAIDPALTRTGRFDLVINFPPPDTQARRDILKVHLADRPVSEDIDLERLSHDLDGLTGADIAAIVTDAARHAASRQINNRIGDHITKDDLARALKRLQSSTALRQANFIGTGD